MEFIRLTEAQRQSFNANGFLKVQRALAPHEVGALLEIGDHRARAFLGKRQVGHRPEYNHIDYRPGWLKERATLSLVAQSPCVPLIVQLLSTNIHLHSTTLIYKRPSDPDLPPFRRGWHRDIRIPRDLGHENVPLVGIKACYCLTDFHTPNSGMTLFAKGTNTRNTPLSIARGEIDPMDVEICDLQADSGDAILFDNRIFHTAAPNLSDRVSKVMIFGYAYRWMKQEVYLDQFNHDELPPVDEITRQLVGAYRDVDTPPYALNAWAKIHDLDQDTNAWVETPAEQTAHQ